MFCVYVEHFLLYDNKLFFFWMWFLVMKSLNSPQDYWQVDRVSSEQKIHKLQDELERMTLENSRLLGRSGVSEGVRMDKGVEMQ